MIELSYAGKLNVFWFIVSLLTVIFTLLEAAGYWPLFELPSAVEYFWVYLLVVFVLINIVLKALYSEFIYAVSRPPL